MLRELKTFYEVLQVVFLIPCESSWHAGVSQSTRQYCADDASVHIHSCYMMQTQGSSVAKSPSASVVPNLSPKSLTRIQIPPQRRSPGLRTGERSGNSHESRLLQVPLFPSFLFVITFTALSAFLYGLLIYLFPRCSMYSSSYPILRDAPSDGCPDEDPIVSPELWPPL